MYGVKEIFKPGEIVVCVDISTKPFRGRKRKDIITVTKFNMYTVQEKGNPYNDSLFIINDLGEKKSYATRRFVSINEFRGPKIDKLIKRIKNDSKLIEFSKLNKTWKISEIKIQKI